MFENLRSTTAPIADPAAPAVETLQEPTADVDTLDSGEACSQDDQDDKGPKGPDALPVRFGATQIKLIAPNDLPHIVEKKQDATVVGYDVFIFGAIYYSRSESRMVQHLVQLLDHATEEQTFTFYISSGGGQVQAMAAIVSAMKRSKARIVTVAVGAVMSAATVIWWAGQERVIYPGAAFMFHFSSHVDYGNSRGISQRAQSLVQYVQQNLLQPMVEEKLLTDLEMSTILSGEDVFIPAMVMQQRMTAAAAAESPAEEPAGDSEAAPAADAQQDDAAADAEEEGESTDA